MRMNPRTPNVKEHMKVLTTKDAPLWIQSQTINEIVRFMAKKEKKKETLMID